MVIATILAPFHQDFRFFIPFLDTWNIQAGKAKPDQQIPFVSVPLKHMLD